MRHRVAWVRGILLVYLVGLALVVLTPATAETGIGGIGEWFARLLTPPGVPVERAYPVIEFTANVALFVPFGLLGAVSFPAARWWLVALCGLGTSVLIELVQLVIPGRVSALSDVIANTLGAAAGAGIVAWSRRRRALVDRRV